MRVGPDDFFHLTYCTNIHPGESWPEVESNLKQYALPLKRRLSPEAPFGIGLRLSNEAARDLVADDRLPRLREWMDENGLYVFTLNGFPFGGFHRQVVKDRVYEPDWRTEARVEYTMRLIDVLEALLPDDVEGSISTSPISYKPWLTEAETADTLQVGARNLIRIGARLHEIHERSGKLIHVGIEPEPDCLIENAKETVDFFNDYLLPASGKPPGGPRGRNNGFPIDADLLRRHVRVCYDACHFAVEFENPSDALTRFDAAGILLSKIQISSALRVDLRQDRGTLLEELRPFAESTYLHQVVARDAGGRLNRYRDLPDALPRLESDRAEEWRIHYHVPIFLERYGLLHSTQSDLLHSIDLILADRRTAHLEIETYTWEVLPNRLKTDAVTSIEREFDWIRGRITS